MIFLWISKNKLACKKRRFINQLILIFSHVSCMHVPIKIDEKTVVCMSSFEEAQFVVCWFFIV